MAETAETTVRGGGDAGAVDHAALHALVRHLAQQGVAGFVACGSTGEAAMLDAAEQDRVLATVLAAAGDKPVLMGLSGVRPQAVAQRAAQFVALHRLLRDQRLAEEIGRASCRERVLVQV